MTKANMCGERFDFKGIDPDQLLQELEGNKQLLAWGTKDENSDGSDSEPSEDNLEEDEIAKFIPIKRKKKSMRKPKELKKDDKQNLSIAKEDKGSKDVSPT